MVNRGKTESIKGCLAFEIDDYEFKQWDFIHAFAEAANALTICIMTIQSSSLFTKDKGIFLFYQTFQALEIFQNVAMKPLSLILQLSVVKAFVMLQSPNSMWQTNKN